MNTAIVSGAIESIKYKMTKGGSRLGIRISRSWGDKPKEYWNIALWKEKADFLKDKVKEGDNICVIGYLSQYVSGEETVVFVNAVEVYPLGDWNISNQQSDDNPSSSAPDKKPPAEESKPERLNVEEDDPYGDEPDDDDGSLNPFSTGW